MNGSHRGNSNEPTTHPPDIRTHARIGESGPTLRASS